MLIDRFLPTYDEPHETKVDAPVDVTYRAVREFDLARSPVVLALLALRGSPHLFTGAVKPSRQLRLDDVMRSGSSCSPRSRTASSCSAPSSATPKLRHDAYLTVA